MWWWECAGVDLECILIRSNSIFTHKWSPPTQFQLRLKKCPPLQSFPPLKLPSGSLIIMLIMLNNKKKNVYSVLFLCPNLYMNIASFTCFVGWFYRCDNVNSVAMCIPIIVLVLHFHWHSICTTYSVRSLNEMWIRMWI